MSGMTEFGQGYSIAKGTQSTRDTSVCSLTNEWCNANGAQEAIYYAKSTGPMIIMPVCRHHGAEVAKGKYPGWIRPEQ